jgi:hypothetical protein
MNVLAVYFKSNTFMTCKFLCIAFFLCALGCSSLKKPLEKENEEKENKQKNIAEWVKQEFAMMKDPTTGKVDRNALWNILDEKVREANINRGNNSQQGIANFTWNSIGPTDFGGRSRAMLISKTDLSYNTAFIGSVSGGIWKTTNLKATNPTWTPVNDAYGNLNIGSFAQDPNDANTIYVGTGEAFYGADGLAGRGILKSTDGGTSFSFLTNTQNNTFAYVPSIKVLSNGNVLAATHSGLYQSINGGINWTLIFGGTNTRFGDLELATDGTLYITTNGSVVDASNGEGCFKSTNNGANWTKLNTAASGMESVDGNIDYTEIAVAPSNPNIIYATITKGNGFINVYKSTNAGINWTVLPKPSTSNYVNQGSFAVSMGIDPNNANVVLTGGLDLYRSTDGGASWSSVSTWQGHPISLHADHHVVYYQPGSSTVAYFLTDGGIQRTNDATASVISYDEIGDNYVTLQFYAIAMTPSFNKFFFLGGTQDNGTWKAFPSSGNQQDVGTEVNGGDGGFTHIDQNEPNNKFCAYVYSNLYRANSTDESLTGFSGVANPYSGKGRFINPSDYDNVNNNMYLCTDAGKFLRWNNAPATESFELVTVPTFGTSTISTVHASAIENNVVFFGLDNGQVIKTSNAHTGTTNNTSVVLGGVAPRTNAFLNCIYQQPNNANTVIISYSSSGGSGRVFLTKNANNGATATWTNVTGNLPNIPVWCVILDPSNEDAAVVGTEFGTYSTTSLSATPVVWSATTTMPNVRVTQLHTRQSDKQLLASTYGRGLFVSDVFVSPVPFFSTNDSISYTGKNIQFTDASLKATSWDWDFTNDGTYDSNSQSPQYAYSTPGTYTVKLRINGNNSLTTTISIKILENRGTPYTELVGGNFETNIGDFYPATTIGASGFSRGNSTQAGKDGTRNASANAWVIDINNPNYVDNSVAYLYTPNYNFLASGSYDLSFYTKFQFESNYDGIIVEYTTNKGTTWNIVGDGIQANWYNSSINASYFPNSTAMFSGAINTYTKVNYNVSSLAGNANVAFRIVFKSDGSVTAAGAAIDDFVLQGPVNSVLSIDELSLSGIYENNFAKLKCIIKNAVEVKEYNIQESTDGQNFTTVKKINTGILNGNITLNKEIAWNYNGTKKYYKVEGITLSNRKFYSNIIPITNKDKAMQLTVAAMDKAKVIVLTNMVDAQYVLYTMDGVQLGAGMLLNGLTLNMSMYAKGTYIIKAIGTSKEVISTRFLLQ